MYLYALEVCIHMYLNGSDMFAGRVSNMFGLTPVWRREASHNTLAGGGTRANQSGVGSKDSAHHKSKHCGQGGQGRRDDRCVEEGVYLT